MLYGPVPMPGLSGPPSASPASSSYFFWWIWAKMANLAGSVGSAALNDAGNQPTEGISQRHRASKYKRDVLNEDWGGQSAIGRMDGSASFIRYRQFTEMGGGTPDGMPRGFVAVPPASDANDVWIGPAYKR